MPARIGTFEPSVHSVPVLIIGAGPAGLWTAFQLGLQGIACHIVDALPTPGGQCTALYGHKPIYDIPGLPMVSGQALADQLWQQCGPLDVTFFGRTRIESLTPLPDGGWQVTGQCDQPSRSPPSESISTSGAHSITWTAQAVVIAAGVGAFVPRPPALPHLAELAALPDRLHYVSAPADPSLPVLIIGGDEAAVDAALTLADERTGPIIWLHRIDKRKADEAELQAAQTLIKQGRIQWVTGVPTDWRLEPDGQLCLDVAQADGSMLTVHTQALLPRLGLSPKLAPLESWGLALQRKQVPVSPDTLATTLPGVYAVGDGVTYPGKLKLIVCGFHEATLAAYAIAHQLGLSSPLQYTTTSTQLRQRLGVA